MNNGFCVCEARPAASIVSDEGVLRHAACGLLIECAFSYLSDDPSDPDAEGTPHPATTRHIDYLVCERHLGIAIDNVAGRWS